MGAELHKRKYLNNPLTGYLSMNSVRNKIPDLRIIIQSLPLDYLVLSKSKLGESFPNAQLNLDGYEIRARRDRNKNGGDLVKFLRRGIVCKRIRNFKLSFSECIRSNLLYQKIDGFVLVYKDPQILVIFQYFLRKNQCL